MPKPSSQDSQDSQKSQDSQETQDSQKSQESQKKPKNRLKRTKPVIDNVFERDELITLFTKKYKKHINKNIQSLNIKAKDSRRNVIIYDSVAGLETKTEDNIKTIIENFGIFNYEGNLFTDGASYVNYEKIIGTDTYGVTYITLKTKGKGNIYMLITPDTATEIISSLYKYRVFAPDNTFLNLINDFKNHGLLNDDQCIEILKLAEILKSNKNVGTQDTNKLNELIEPTYLNYISPYLNTMDRNLLTYHLIINLKDKVNNITTNIKTIKDIMNYEPVSKLLLYKLVSYEVNGGVLLLTFETVVGLRYIVLDTNDNNFNKQLSNYVIKRKEKNEIIKYVKNTKKENKIRSQMNSDVNSADAAGAAKAQYHQYCYGS